MSIKRLRERPKTENNVKLFETVIGKKKETLRPAIRTNHTLRQTNPILYVIKKCTQFLKILHWNSYSLKANLNFV